MKSDSMLDVDELVAVAINVLDPIKGVQLRMLTKMHMVEQQMYS